MKLKTLNCDELAARIGTSRSTVYRMREAGDLPEPEKVPGRKGLVWREKTIAEWERANGYGDLVAEQERILAFHKMSEAKITEFCKYLDKLQTYKRYSEGLKAMSKATATMLRNPLIPLLDRCRVYDITMQWFEAYNSNPEFDDVMPPLVTKMILDGSIFKWLDGVEDAKRK